MYRLVINTVAIEAATPAEVMALVALVSGREAQSITPPPVKATLVRKITSRSNGHGVDSPDERRQRILATLRDRPMMARDLRESLQNISAGTLHNDLAALERAGRVMRGDLGYAVTDPSPATSTM